MSFNKTGTLFSFSTWGESHGEAIGCVVDGVPSNIPLSEEDIQPFLDARKPGQSRFTTQRKEPDQVKILSGVFEGKTTGTPVSLIIENQDHRSKDYGDIKHKFRPGHADYTYHVKYGNRDYRGGGRASARETAMRVAAGAIARKVLGESITIRGALVQIGDKAISRDNWDWNQTHQNPFWSPDASIVEEWSNYLDGIRKEGSSIGAVVEIIAEGVPAGWGDPIYSRLDATIASAMMGINAVKGVEIGAGFASAALRGEENADEIHKDAQGNVVFSSNNAGGILGGITSGQPIAVRFAVKPTSSILIPRKTIDVDGNNTEVMTKGRHDPCVGIRAVPIGEAMLACVLADAYLCYQAYN